MNLSKFFKNAFLVMLACLVLSACATKKVQNQMQGDVYTGTETDGSDPSWSSLLSN